jgi:hypothetical protein
MLIISHFLSNKSGTGKVVTGGNFFPMVVDAQVSNDILCANIWHAAL